MDKGGKVVKITDYLKKQTNKRKEELRKQIEKKMREARRIYDG